ncbi:MAG: aldo/keto reductase [Truepera sp.]|nr:aldo/keto reductase [Truepera sp.]
MLNYVDRIIVGCWQLSEGHSGSGGRFAFDTLEAYYEAGFRVFDCADIYTGVEALLGTFIRANGLSSRELFIHTKYVPDLTTLPTLSPEQTEAAIDRSLARLGVERLDLVQFHWWDYRVPGYLGVLDTLCQLQKRGRITEIGLTNFDAERTEEILDHGVPVASIQTQYSVIDRRPAGRLAALGKAHGIPLLCYGSVAGGLLSNHYLSRPKPQEPYENRSLTKYLLMLEEMGDWESFQGLLQVLSDIAEQRDTDVATVASAYCLEQEAVRACIVGVRNTDHLDRHVALRDTVTLTGRELGRIESARSTLGEIPGAVYALERDSGGRHGRIMSYELNSESA